MRFVFFLYHDEVAWANLPAEERNAEIQKYMAFYQEVNQRGIMEASAKLQPSQSATSVRIQGEQLEAGDGPYANTKEQLGGVYILDCEDLDEAIELAKTSPAARWGAVEIRPIFE